MSNPAELGPNLKPKFLDGFLEQDVKRADELWESLGNTDEDRARVFLTRVYTIQPKNTL